MGRGDGDGDGVGGVGGGGGASRVSFVVSWPYYSSLLRA